MMIRIFSFLNHIKRKKHKSEIRVEICYLEDESESYILNIKRDLIQIKGCRKGVFYGLQTLKQLLEQEYLVELVIKDKPLYKHRGLLVDCSRHFFSIKTLKKIVDLMSALKLNILHWHLTDDQGFRIENNRYEHLNQIGSTREGTYLYDYYDSKEVSGYYTKEEIKEFVLYASERYIEIIPEFDLPGHFTAIIAAYNELSCDQKKISVPTTFGVHKTIACAGNDETLKFIKNVLDEIIPLFPSKYVHIGGDEAPKDRWKECELCQKRIKDEQLVDERHLQSWLMNNVSNYLINKGKEVIIWNDGYHLEYVNESIIYQHWFDGNDYPNTKKAAKSNRKLIISDARYLYFDYSLYKTSLRKTYNFDIKMNGLENTDTILGGEMAIWTEYIQDESQLMSMLKPRIYAGAERFWSYQVDFKDFKNRLKKIDSRFVETESLPNRFIKKIKAEIKNKKGLKIQKKYNV
jgi:hexosaminidase